MKSSSDYVLISKASLALALNALRRDATEGKVIRGEIADEIEKSCIDLEDYEKVKDRLHMLRV